jgi:hypothetical protein
MPVSAPPHTHALRLDRLRPELVVSGLRARLSVRCLPDHSARGRVTGSAHVGGDAILRAGARANLNVLGTVGGGDAGRARAIVAL